MSFYDIFIISLIIAKTIFILLAIYAAYLTKKNGDKETIEKIEFWKKRIEFIFVTCMAFLLIYLFTPFKTKIVPLNYETRLLIYMLGWILLITADWGVFFKESKLLQMVQSTIGKA